MWNAETALVIVVAIAAGIIAGQWLSNKFENWNAQPITQSEAAEIVQPQSWSLEAYMDAWPNV